MFEFLQGFAWGLGLSCLPWFLIGMFKPHLALPHEVPHRGYLFLRYAIVVPFIAFLCWTTSLWGGWWIPSLGGWMVGLGAIPAGIFIERRWRRWHALRREQKREAEQARRTMILEQEAREAGLLTLDPDLPPVGADAMILALCEAKRSLQGAKRPDLALQTDRLYTRYAHIQDVLRNKFDERELTYGRAQALVTEVCYGMLDTLSAMGSLAMGVVNVDADFARRRLEDEAHRLPEEERQALRGRLTLIDETEQRLQALNARNETALTTLDDAAVAIAGIETGRSQASVATEQALQDLRRFAEKAQRYGRND